MVGVGRAAGVVVWLSATAWAAPPPMVGLYRAGELGILEMAVTDGHVTGHFKGGGNCSFTNQLQVISGNFEGDVFVGTAFVCQEGPSCEKEKTFPFLAVYHSGSLAGDIKLDVGCSSPGLEGRRLNVSSASAEDRLLLGRENGSSASQTANRNANKKDLQERAGSAFRDARVAFASQNFVAARTAIDRSLMYDDSNWQAWQLSGGVELELKNVEKGLQSFEKAVLNARNAHLTDLELGDLFYNLACAQSLSGKRREALGSLRNALKVGDGQSIVGEASKDHQLDGIREDPEFKRILTDATKKPRRPR